MGYLETWMQILEYQLRFSKGGELAENFARPVKCLTVYHRSLRYGFNSVEVDVLFQPFHLNYVPVAYLGRSKYLSTSPLKMLGFVPRLETISLTQKNKLPK